MGSPCFSLFPQHSLNPLLTTPEVKYGLVFSLQESWKRCISKEFSSHLPCTLVYGV